MGMVSQKGNLIIIHQNDERLKRKTQRIQKTQKNQRKGIQRKERVRLNPLNPHFCYARFCLFPIHHPLNRCPLILCPLSTFHFPLSPCTSNTMKKASGTPTAICSLS